ncbi:uncharacterized protein LOC129949389 [Eupeodes corollae]|uniref:uncharacterized protein LOC129949389 n=1 Tax=Eupeodes corollae TaxID=290404 RepID=UPI0024915DC9|nr:uncharacterized protein LOC129949389 [Eupeodes corollae]
MTAPSKKFFFSFLLTPDPDNKKTQKYRAAGTTQDKLRFVYAEAAPSSNMDPTSTFIISENNTEHRTTNKEQPPPILSHSLTLLCSGSVSVSVRLVGTLCLCLHCNEILSLQSASGEGEWKENIILKLKEFVCENIN